MSATVMDGKLVSQSIKDYCKKEADALKAKGIVPKLGIFRVGAKGPDLQYEKGAKATMAEAGIEVEVFELPADVTQDEYIEKFKAVNADPAIHGILAFRPLDNIDENAAINAIIDPCKDIDACTGVNMGKMTLADPTGLYPCTPSAVMEILDYYGIDCKGKNAVVIGRSLVVGKPAAMMLMGKNATVTVCHTRTVNTAEIARGADILVSAAGVLGSLTKEFVRPGQVVIDVSINWDHEKVNSKGGKGAIAGDAKFDEVEPIVEAITPVPGGVGSVTTSVLIGHVIEAAIRKAGK